MQINQENMRTELAKLIQSLLSLPEIATIRIVEVQITRGETFLDDKLQQAIQQSYHDCYSDIDLHVIVDASKAAPDLLARYAERWERFGFRADAVLGAMTSPSNVCRMVLKNGMRYDLVFEFSPAFTVTAPTSSPSGSLWPIEHVNRFWFIQIQALGKLYRNDYLISLHLANSNLNETLVQQMVLRDKQYGTTHHCYGYREEIAYLRYQNQCPILTRQQPFDMIAAQLWCAALAYDELVQQFDPGYEPRSPFFLEIWKCYEQNRLAER